MRSAAKYVWIIIAITFVGGFLFAQASGLLGRAPVTTTTAVAKVNGAEILYTDYERAVQNRSQQASQQLGRALTLDEDARLRQEVFDDMVNDALLQQEYKKRGITVTDEEIIKFAQTSPPPELLRSPELQTEGQFDPAKYRRYLANPAAREGGLLQYLEAYYRQEIPRQKLFMQVTSDVYPSDARLWSMWRDSHDSAQVTYAALRTDLISDSSVKVSDDEISSYYDAHKKQYERPGRAVLSLLTIPRAVTAADTAAARARAEQLRAEIVGGQKFEDVAKRESSDSGSARQGGDLGRGGKGRFVPEFEKAAYALTPGEVSQPVLSPFGYHLIRVDEKKGDTLSVRHILVPIGQSDSSAARTDREADAVAKLAASQEDPKKFDQAVAQYKLSRASVVALEGEPVSWLGKPVPSVSAWAFGGAKVGETSDLYDAPDAYYLARLDSLTQGGQQPLSEVKEEIRHRIAQDKKVEQLVPRAEKIAQQAASSSLEQAAAANGTKAEQTPVFSRTSLVPGLGQFTQAIGAAFALPKGALSGPVPSRDGVYVLRIDRRVDADKGAWQAQKAQQRDQVTNALRQQRIREYLAGLRESAKIVDNRKDVQAAARRQSAT
ncbi:SurA N-terminal domain-containing protein [Gemmatirosa kalamazoonensis]|nr:peptidyl-prolyl cis-trans isomerase [Gemmatirosa kalamazoonensis]